LGIGSISHHDINFQGFPGPLQTIQGLSRVFKGNVQIPGFSRDFQGRANHVTTLLKEKYVALTMGPITMNIYAI
jgi:hypothetical protein